MEVLSDNQSPVSVQVGWEFPLLYYACTYGTPAESLDAWCQSSKEVVTRHLTPSINVWKYTVDFLQTIIITYTNIISNLLIFESELDSNKSGP